MSTRKRIGPADRLDRSDATIDRSSRGAAPCQPSISPDRMSQRSSPWRSSPAPPADAALLAAANAAQPAVIASLKDMVSIESGSTNAAGLAKMADYVEARLQVIGARTERIAPARGP